MKKTTIVILITIVMVSICGYLLLTKENDKGIKSLEYKEISKVVDSSEYTLIYFGEIDDTVINRLNGIKEESKINVYTTNATNDELNIILKSNNLDEKEIPLYVLFVDGTALTTIDKDVSDSSLSTILAKYLYNIIPEEERYYKTIDNASAFIKKVNSKNYTISVFGRQSCTYCNLYLPIINEISKKHDLDIYYFDSDTYNTEEYNKILELNFTIPGKCNSSGEDKKMKLGFSKPLTIITKEGKLVDCIKGYVTESAVEELLKEYKIIKG